MHFKTIILISIIFPVIVSSKNPMRFIDLFSWDVEDGNQPKKRDESYSNEVQRACACNGGPSCTCCIDFNITYFDFGEPGCVHMKYVSKEQGISVNVSYGENVIHSEHVKGPNPEPICMSVLMNLAKICARFSHLHNIENGLKGCLQLEPKLFDRIQGKFQIGCFTLGPDGIKQDDIINKDAEKTSLNVNQNGNDTETETEELNEEELISAVNETAEQGLAFFGSFLGLFEEPDANVTNLGSINNTNSGANNSPTVNTSRTMRILSLPLPLQNRL